MPGLLEVLGSRGVYCMVSLVQGQSLGRTTGSTDTIFNLSMDDQIYESWSIDLFSVSIVFSIKGTFEQNKSEQNRTE
jgi:hypothetical protein